MDSEEKISRELLESMRQQGLDEQGQPKTSYWKARIEAEEGRVRVAELEAEIAALRTPGATAAAPESGSKIKALEAQVEQGRVRIAELEKELKAAKAATQAPAATKAESTKDTARQRELEDEVKRSRLRIAELEAALKTRASSSASSSTGTESERVAALEREMQDMDQQRQRGQQTLMARIREFQEANAVLQKEVRESLKSRNHWQEKAQALEQVVADLRERRVVEADTNGPIGAYPSVQNLLEWLGVGLDDGRVVAVGEAHRDQIRIEVRKGKLARVVQVEQGTERTYQTLDLTAPAHELLGLVLPAQRYYEHRTDPRVLDACRLLGRALPTN